MKQPKFDRLKNKLASAKVRQDDYTLYQVIESLIDYIRQMQTATGEVIISGNVDVSNILNSTLLTDDDESTLFPNSRQLLAGSGISFDDSIAGQRTLNNISLGSEWDVLTDGHIDETELIYAGGEVIMLEISG